MEPLRDVGVMLNQAQQFRERLRRIREIIEAVDNRCLAVDGPVRPTLEEMTQDEISEIYALAGGVTAKE